jgi:hypothetical protein
VLGNVEAPPILACVGRGGGEYVANDITSAWYSLPILILLHLFHKHFKEEEKDISFEDVFLLSLSICIFLCGKKRAFISYSPFFEE